MPLALTFLPIGGTRPAYLETKGAVDILFVASHKEGLVLNLPAEAVCKSRLSCRISANGVDCSKNEAVWALTLRFERRQGLNSGKQRVGKEGCREHLG